MHCTYFTIIKLSIDKIRTPKYLIVAKVHTIARCISTYEMNVSTQLLNTLYDWVSKNKKCFDVRAEWAFGEKAKASSKYLGYTRHRARLSQKSSRACACAESRQPDEVRLSYRITARLRARVGFRWNRTEYCLLSRYLTEWCKDSPKSLLAYNIKNCDHTSVFRFF